MPVRHLFLSFAYDCIVLMELYRTELYRTVRARTGRARMEWDGMKCDGTDQNGMGPTMHVASLIINRYTSSCLAIIYRIEFTYHFV